MVRGEIHVYYSPEAAKLALELPLLSVDGLVLLQGVLVTKGLAADEAGEARLPVHLLIMMMMMILMMMMVMMVMITLGVLLYLHHHNYYYQQCL